MSLTRMLLRKVDGMDGDWDLRSLLILRPLMKRHGINECLYVYV